MRDMYRPHLDNGKTRRTSDPNDFTPAEKPPATHRDAQSWPPKGARARYFDDHHSAPLGLPILEMSDVMAGAAGMPRDFRKIPHRMVGLGLSCSALACA